VKVSNDNQGDKPVSVPIHTSYIPVSDENFRTTRFHSLFFKSAYKRSIHKRVYSTSSRLLYYKHTHLHRHILYTWIHNNPSQFNVIHILCNRLNIQYLIQQTAQPINNHLSFMMSFLHVLYMLQYTAIHQGININWQYHHNSLRIMTKITDIDVGQQWKMKYC
jgi:hypothetical protein